MSKSYRELTPEEKLFLDDQLTKEIIYNERMRAKLLGSIAFVMLLIMVSFIIFFRAQYSSFIMSLTPTYISAGILAVVTIRGFIMSKVLMKEKMKKIMSRKKRRDFIRYVWIIFEISIPTFISFVYSFYPNAQELLTAPIIWGYFLIIILSTLSLDFYLSAVAGTVAALEYLVVIFLVVDRHPLDASELYAYEPFINFSRCVMLFLSGVTAGYVANQLKNKIINTHITLLERNRVINLFDQQVSREIVDELVANYHELESKRKFVCVMFLDIRDFTHFAEKMQPEEIIKYQNNVFSFMIEIITKNNGIINQFLGDGYMATFGAPITRGNDCLNAVKASLEIIKTIEQKNKEGIISQTRIGIGLHAGEVVAGNVGTDVRKQYSISGNTVILASRIEELNKEFGTQLLISKEVLEQIEQNGYNAEFFGSVPLKGREKPVDVFKLV
ncbi:MAG: adenylate/guanylate cyclase domain-containing protein [Ignavibacteriales bacterium]|nr:adenylate/guanylate cyclase domain-containing protein [Ignavibacteriales bacterium]